MSQSRSWHKQLERHIRTLQRRADWLDRRIANYNGRNPSRDIAELHALRYAICALRMELSEVERRRGDAGQWERSDAIRDAVEREISTAPGAVRSPSEQAPVS